MSSLQRQRHPGQSLPDLRSDIDLDSGDSTDSLIDEAEEYLRRSIDSILTGADWGRVGRRRQNRRYSEPDPVRGKPLFLQLYLTSHLCGVVAWMYLI